MALGEEAGTPAACHGPDSGDCDLGSSLFKAPRASITPFTGGSDAPEPRCSGCSWVLLKSCN